jgi:hypothetical protein
MGDRGNICVRQRSYPGELPAHVWLYAHSGGRDLPVTLRTALRRKQRWDDETYLARIIFCMMLGSASDLSGFGISTRMTDNQCPILLVDCRKKTVSVCEPDALLSPSRTVTFDEYVAMSHTELQVFRDGPEDAP